jgi:lysozyme
MNYIVWFILALLVYFALEPKLDQTDAKIYQLKQLELQLLVLKNTKRITSLEYKFSITISKDIINTSGLREIMQEKDLVFSEHDPDKLTFLDSDGLSCKDVYSCIAEGEGRVLSKDGKHLPYRDTSKKCGENGCLTVGYGCNVDSGCLKDAGINWNGKYLTEEQAREALIYHVKLVEKEIPKFIPCFDELSEPRKAVLVDMGYNMGYTALKDFDYTIGLICDKKYFLAANNIKKNTRYYKQVKQRGERNVQILVKDKFLSKGDI